LFSISYFIPKYEDGGNNFPFKKQKKKKRNEKKGTSGMKRINSEMKRKITTLTNTQ
jgi:hypothetical protein